MADDKLLKDLKKSKVYILAANIIAAILFTFVALYIKNYWLFIPVALLLIASFTSIFLYKKIENKYRNMGIIK
ncbi:MAG: hypothetical protein HZB41_05775 [Ignavibacteriae bacterium]|nr:hypothetical protein [Ignavibacteriota bacterium]